MDSKPSPENFFKSACYFEGSLIIVAIILAQIADINPIENLYFSEAAIFYGVIGTLPLVLMFLAMENMNFKSTQKIKELLLETLGSSLAPYHWTDLLILATVAGISEEILFRGVLQPWLENAWGMNAGLIFSSIIFGLVHAVTPLYAILATLVSVYLGLCLDYGESRNLLTPIVIHSLYDFVAFLLLMRNYNDYKNSKSDS